MTAQTILPANTLSGGYEVANSVRLFSNTFLHKTPTGNSNKQVFTFSTWLKRGNLGAEMGIFTAGDDSNRNGFFTVMFADDDALNIQFYDGAFDDLKTNRVFRDVSAWYHIVVAVDTTDGTAANRIKVYVNGVQESSFASSDYPDQNQNFDINEDANDVYVGVRRNTGGSPAGYYDGYIAEAVLIDGTQLAPTSFGEFDEDSPTIWKPIDVSDLTFGTNGFYLDFEDSGTLGNDVSGGTDLTANNIVATDQSTDTCTNNFATLNPLFPAGGTLTFSEGNTSISAPNDGNWKTTLATMAAQNGKWYMEFKSGGNYAMVGVCDFNITSRGIDGDNFGTKTTISAYGYGYYNGDGTVRYEGGTELSYGDTYGNGDIVGIALDCDNDKLYFSKNGTFQNSGDPTSGATGTNAVSLNTTAGRLWGFAFSIYQTNDRFANFGSPAFAISSGNADANGHGNFEYAVPSGYYAINTKNLSQFG